MGQAKLRKIELKDLSLLFQITLYLKVMNYKFQKFLISIKNDIG